MQKVMFSVMLLISGEIIFAQSDRKLAVSAEGGLIWQNRNDIRIPNATGTQFSLPDLIGNGPYGVFRAEVDFDINERHGLRFAFAPLEITDSGILSEGVSFAGEVFGPENLTEANYKFSSYRITYRYRFYGGPTWSWKIGATGFIRDARIALNQTGKYAEDTDLGFVPLVHLQGLARMGDNWRFLLDFDGLAASQGRAFDVAAKVGYLISDHLELAFGYRVIEGGADVERVYNFAWFNSLVGAVRLSF